MMDTLPIEQLWYTWSDVGLSSIHAGFRVRAASPSLTEIYGPRVQSMDRYMRYNLPPGTDAFAITPEMAPVGLAFIHTDQNEYILVHKNYSGKDGVGRPGNFFVHVLALGTYSDYFSTEDAIWLWDAPLWKTNDQSLDRRSTTLQPLPLSILVEDDNPRFRPQYAQVQHALSFVIEAYLTRKGSAPIYIGAPAHQAAMIASVIAGLTGCLPKQLLANLTFSTYEPDIAKATTGIVGTSWIATAGQTAEAVMPAQWYRDHLAINCATGEHSRLMGHPQIDANPLAAHFAAYAADCLIANTMQELEDLCERAENSQALTPEMFLQRYNDEIANAENIGEVDIERNLSNADLYLDRLNSQIFRKKIIDCALANPQWGETKLAPILDRLCAQAARASVSPASVSIYATAVPEQQQIRSIAGPQKSSTRKKARAQTKAPKLPLAEALAQLAKRAIPEIVDRMRQVAKAQKAGTMSSSEPALARQQIIALITVMNSCLTTQGSSEVWQMLFTPISKSPSAIDYLKTQWDIRSWLLGFWNNALPITEEVDNAVRPLIGIPWSRFGKFLKVSLPGRHKQWLVFAVEGVLADASLTLQIAQDLTQNYAKEIYLLLSQFLQDAHYTIATDLLVKLVEHGYRIEGPSLNSLVEQLLTRLQRDGLWQYAKGLVVALTQSRYVGLATYQSLIEELLGNLLTNAPAEGNTLLDLLVDYGYPRKKSLLDCLLATGRGRADTERSIERVYRTPEEQNAFFLHDAAPLLHQRDTAQAMVSIYWALLRVFPQDGKMARLFVLLEGSLDETTILSLFDNSSLIVNEQIQLLEQFGSRYLLVAQQAQRLTQRLIDWFDQLVQGQYTNGASLLFHLLDPGIDPQYLEHLLKAASLSVPESQQLFKNYGRAARYVPFFRQSPTALKLFERFAQIVNSYVGKAQWQQLSEEKMDVLSAWLNPSLPLNNQQAIVQILLAANLIPDEQIGFLDAYGAHYLSLSTRLPILKEYISTYAFNFTTDDLDWEETQPFFTMLKQSYQRLPLDEKTKKLIQDWQTISDYLAMPSMYPEALTNLARALFDRNLPNNARFTTRLAQAFVRCIQTSEDLTNIMQYMQQIPKLRDDELRFLYVVAERAMLYYPQQATGPLVPYLLFALTWNKQPPLKKHFRHVFLDTLLRDVQETDLATWSKLHTIVMQQGLPPEAVERWKFYLNRLGLLDQISTTEETTSSTTAPSQSFWPSWPGKRNKQQAAPPVPNSHEAAAPEHPEQRSPSAQKGPLPHQQQKALDIGGSRPDANLSQGGTEFHVQGADSKQKRKR